MAYVAAVDDLTVIKTLLTTNWSITALPVGTVEPEIILWNEASQQRRSLKGGDIISIAFGTNARQEVYRGMGWAFKDQTTEIAVTCQTTISRQRVLDLTKEVRRVLFGKVHASTEIGGYQVLRYKGFSEAGEANVKNWRLTISCSLESAGIAVNNL